MYSSTADVDDKIATLRQTFKSGLTKDVRFRKWQLKQLYWLVDDNRDAILAAVHKDLGRHEFEALLSDINSVTQEVLHHLTHVEQWAKPTIPDSGFFFTRIGKTYIRHEPLGTVLIIGPWNYPLSLILQPLASAIAAGCTALLKPSEVAPTCSALLSTLIPQYLDPAAYAVVTGGVQETQYILTQKFNHIFFTGSTPIARHVATAAAKHLTPVTLELGGQGPAIVTRSADVNLAAKRIVATKFMNAGQICLNVNHVMVDPAVKAELEARLLFWLREFDRKGAKEQMGSIVDGRNYDRLTRLLGESKGRVMYGGEGNKERLKLDLTLVGDVEMDDSLMSEELFGPVLPLVEADLKKAVQVIGEMPHPLAIYIFTQDDAEVQYLLDHTNSGGVTVNDTLLHAAAPEVPFGGVGDSGTGAYHGRHGFDTFTHRRTVVRMPNWLDSVMSFRYPPYDVKKNAFFIARKAPFFKKGETMADQRVGGGSWLNWSSAGLVVAVGVVAFAVQSGRLPVKSL